MKTPKENRIEVIAQILREASLYDSVTTVAERILVALAALEESNPVRVPARPRAKRKRSAK